MVSIADTLDQVTVGAPAVLLEEGPARVDVAVHDASRLGWQVVVPLPEVPRMSYAFEVELEVPTNLVGMMDPWAGLQSYARLDGADGGGKVASDGSIDHFRRSVVAVAAKLARARDGFLRHCTLLCSSAIDENHWRPLMLWLAAASTELARARSDLLRAAPREVERTLADEFLSIQLWTVLTDSGRALFETRRVLEDRDDAAAGCLDEVESRLAQALRAEIAYRHEAGFALPEPSSVAQLERMVGRMRWLKRYFERVLFLEAESYVVQNRLSGWFSAFAAMLAYLWFLLWQLTLERHPVAIGSGVVAFALLTAVAYASRERLKEVGRNWLAGRVQRIFAQRVSRYRLPRERPRAAGPVVVSARESFSQSSAQRTEAQGAEEEITRDVTLLRFSHRGFVASTPPTQSLAARQLRLIYRLDLSSLFPRLHDAVRGFASVDRHTGRIAIVDVPRNYALPLRTSLRFGEQGRSEAVQTLVLNKNGLLRVDAR